MIPRLGRRGKLIGPILVSVAIAGGAFAAGLGLRPELRGAPLLDEPGFHVVLGVTAAAVATVVAAILAAFAGPAPRMDEGADHGDQP